MRDYPPRDDRTPQRNRIKTHNQQPDIPTGVQISNSHSELGLGERVCRTLASSGSGIRSGGSVRRCVSTANAWIHYLTAAD